MILAISLAGLLLSIRGLLLVTVLTLADAYALYLAGMPAALLLRQQHGTPLLTLSLVFAVSALIMVLTTRRFQHVRDERAGLYRVLQEKEQYQAQLLAQLLTAQERERHRLAHNLHDGPLQDLSVLLLTLESCRRHITAPDLPTALADVQHAHALSDAVFVTLRTLMSDLRPPTLDTVGLVAALEQLALQQTTFRVALTTDLVTRLDPPLETLLFRLVQEGLANIRQHAHAHHAWIRVDATRDTLWLEIGDDGQGFAVEAGRAHALATGHLGLASMQERVTAAGGHWVIASAPDQGTTLQVRIPCPLPPAQLGPAPTLSPPQIVFSESNDTAPLRAVLPRSLVLLEEDPT